ncbi:hypothetical protein [Niveibacterium terrae]|uniref:hypothetical protein n=1 Tax=Niveibacterium terrae TaxID=3373598 RepID=UPI003A9571CA
MGTETERVSAGKTPTDAPREESATPDSLIPSLDKIDNREPAYYRSLFFLESLGGGQDELQPLKEPIDPFDDRCLPDEATTRPAVGMLTVHKQSWRQKGLALGNLLQSICLAPGEVTQIAVTRWERTTTGSSSEISEQAEAVSNEAEQNRAVNEVQKAVATETQSGSSSVQARSSSVQAGGSFWFASASAASASSSSMTAQFSSGSRNLAAESTNSIAQHTAEASHALRSRRQSVVREVTEQETETTSSRILANYNRRHTLNVLFFEVLQAYEVRTRLDSWERCLFIPMVPLDFEKSGVIIAHQAELLALFREFGATEMIEHLNRAQGQQEAASQAIAAYAHEKSTMQDALKLAQEFDAAQKRLEEAKESLSQGERGLRIKTQELEDFSKGLRKLVSPRQTEHQKSLMEGIVSHSKAEIADSTRALDEIRAKWAALAGQSKDLPQIESAAEQMRKRIEEHEARIAGYRIPVGEIFNRHRTFLSQQLWLRMSSYRIHRILQGFTIPESGDSPAQPLSSLVDPQPVGVYGNYLAFCWGFPKTEAGYAAREAFAQKHLTRHEAATTPDTEGLDEDGGAIKHEVCLPTSGIFSEAILGQGLAAELIDKRFAGWSDPDNKIPLLPPKIADLVSRDRTHGMDLKPQDFAASLAQLRADKLADISHIEQLLTQLGKGDMFRNMGGLEQAAKLAEKLADLSAEEANKAGDRAVQLQTKVLDAFEKVITSDAVKSALADAIVPGSGEAAKAIGKGKAATTEAAGKK